MTIMVKWYYFAAPAVSVLAVCILAKVVAARRNAVRIRKREDNRFKEIECNLDLTIQDDEQLAESFKKHILKFNPEPKKGYVW